MGERVVGTHGLSSATGWWMTVDHSLYEPVAVWLLADIFDEEFPTLGVSRKIIGLKGEEIGAPQDLDLESRWYYHDTQFETVGKELK
jgi:hypothetical protein